MKKGIPILASLVYGVLLRQKNIFLYSHVTTVADDVNIKALENKFNKNFEVLENQARETTTTFESRFTEKCKLFESQIDNLQKDLEIKNKHIISLEAKIEEMGKEQESLKKLQQNKIKEQEK